MTPLITAHGPPGRSIPSERAESAPCTLLCYKQVYTATAENSKRSHTTGQRCRPRLFQVRARWVEVVTKVFRAFERG